ncbi:MAG: arginine decarboxylase, partial [Lentisphaerae bacterium]|nr:arginine decarboxylase [Lentisphaerota bacterium]
MNIQKETLEHWTAEDSAELYGIHNWGNGYFDVNDQGELVLLPYQGSNLPSVSLLDVINGIKDRGMDMPVLLRVSNILDSQIRLLHSSFRNAIKQTGYKGVYKG